MTTDDVAARLTAIRERHAVTTPGKWWNETHVVHAPIPGNPGAACHPLTSPLLGPHYMEDAEFAAQAHQDVPWLLAEHDRLTARVTELEGALGKIRTIASSPKSEPRDLPAGARTLVLMIARTALEQS